MRPSSVTSKWRSSAVPGWLNELRVDRAAFPLSTEREPRRTW